MLITMKSLLKIAQKNHFAVGAFNVADSNFLRVVTEEAEASQSPAIIAIHPIELQFLTDEFISYVIRRVSASNIPYVIHLDHGASMEDVVHAIHCGFTSVMIDGSLKPYEENVRETAEVVCIAHKIGVSVEGELGTIGNTGKTIEGGITKVQYTDPKQAKDFVERTGVDSLAIAIGTAHGIYPKDVKPELNMQILKEIRDIVDVPLVLHGGSSNPDEEIKKAIKLGIQKVNISSDMKFAFFKKCREILSTTELWDPNLIYPECIKEARKVVRHKMELFDSIGKVKLYEQLTDEFLH